MRWPFGRVSSDISSSVRQLSSFFSKAVATFVALTHNTRLRNSAILVLASSLLTSAIGFVSAPILALLVPKDEYGTLAYIGSITGLVVAISAPGASNAISYSVARGFEGVYRTGSLYRLKIYLRNSLVLLPVAGWYYWVGRDLNFALMLIVGAVTLPWSSALDTGEQFLVSRSDFRLLFWRRLGVSIVIALSGIAVALIRPTALSVFTVRSIAASLLTVFIYLWVCRELRNQTMDTEFWPKAKAFSWISILGSISKTTDRLVLGKMGTLSELAAYSLAASMCIPVEILGKSLIKLSFGHLQTPRTSHERHLMMLLSIGSAAVGVFFVFALLNTFGHWLSLIFPKYPEMLRLLKPLLVISVIQFANALPHTHALFHNYGSWTWYNTSRNALTIPLTAIVVFVSGVWGAIFLKLFLAIIDYLFFFWLLLCAERHPPRLGVT
jgi:O-antigen/teichoic acid export membrane protein